MEETSAEAPLQDTRCPHCGEGILPFMRFCSACGCALSGNPAAWPTPESPNDSSQPLGSARKPIPPAQAAAVPPVITLSAPTAARADDREPSPLGQYGATRSSPERAQELPNTCAQHPDVIGLLRCAVCQAAICYTCAFQYPGGADVCPSRIISPSEEMPRNRFYLLLSSYAMAVSATLGVLIFIWTASSRPDDPVRGSITVTLAFFPNFLGAGLAIATYEKRLPNPPAVWLSIIWNCTISVLMVLVILAALTVFFPP